MDRKLNCLQRPPFAILYPHLMKSYKPLICHYPFDNLGTRYAHWRLNFLDVRKLVVDLYPNRGSPVDKLSTVRVIHTSKTV